MPLVETAPAKINLTLHIVGRRGDGWHELESLVAFSREGDTLSFGPGPELTLVVDGPSAGATGSLDDNLVVRVAKALALRVEGLRLGSFRLEKRLPVAAGIGGGSSDAAAALRLLARVNDIALDDPRLTAAAAACGADIPVCLPASARMMSGLGEVLGPALELPPLPALLVNPRIPLETKTVFGKMNRQPGSRTSAPAHLLLGERPSLEALIGVLKRGRNDMEDAACVLAPVVGDVLAVLGAAPGCKLARMSGSGATCFGIFGDSATASRAEDAIKFVHPNWWTMATTLA